MPEKDDLLARDSVIELASGRRQNHTVRNMAAIDDQHGSVAPQSGVFATTHWSVVLAAGDSKSPGSDDALARLCRNYWYPL